MCTDVYFMRNRLTISGAFRRIDVTGDSAMGDTKYNPLQGYVQERLTNGRD